MNLSKWCITSAVFIIQPYKCPRNGGYVIYHFAWYRAFGIWDLHMKTSRLCYITERGFSTTNQSVDLVWTGEIATMYQFIYWVVPMFHEVIGIRCIPFGLFIPNQQINYLVIFPLYCDVVLIFLRKISLLRSSINWHYANRYRCFYAPICFISKRTLT